MDTTPATTSRDSFPWNIQLNYGGIELWGNGIERFNGVSRDFHLKVETGELVQRVLLLCCGDSTALNSELLSDSSSSES